MITTTQAWRAVSGTLFLIAANCLIFVVTSATGSESWVTAHFGLFPSHADLANPMFLLSIFTSAFIHHDAIHLFTNVLLLLWTGLIVEKYVGTMRFLLLYGAAIVLCGAVETLAFLHVGHFVAFGASGAVGAVIGAAGVILIRERVVSWTDFIHSTITMVALVYAVAPLLQYLLPPQFNVGMILIVLCQFGALLLPNSQARSLLMSGVIGWTVVQTAVFAVSAFLATGQGLPMLGVAWETHAAGLMFGAAALTLLGWRRAAPAS